MARTLLSSQAGWGVAVLAIMLCSQMAMATTTTSRCTQCSAQQDDSTTLVQPKHFIMVHGIGGGAWFWYEMITLLEHFGHKATAVDLTSHGINKAIADKVETVAEYTQPLVDAIHKATGQVILVGHSLGGGSIAYASELFPLKVSKAIYLSAVMPSYNQSMFGAFPANTFPNLLDAGHLTLNMADNSTTPTSATINRDTLEQFYMSETPKRYVNLARLLVTDTPYRPGTEVLPLSSANFGSVRRFYIRTGKDLGVRPGDQDEIIAKNPPEKVFCMAQGDHAVFFSAPFDLFRILKCIARL